MKSISYRVAPVPLRTYSSLNIMGPTKKYFNAPMEKDRRRRYQVITKIFKLKALVNTYIL